MYALMIYSLKVGVCLAVFYLFFKLLLSRETFHRLNRILVLGAVMLSFALPLCVITVYREVSPLPEFQTVGEEFEMAVDEPLAEPFPWKTLAGGIFLAGAVVTLLWTLRSLFGVLHLIRRGRRERLEDGTVLVHAPQSVTPFSWGRYVVISEEDRIGNGEAILLHERAHRRLRHTLDLVVTDLAGCLQWFNPAMWLLRRELRAIHEYEADAAVLGSGVDAKSYQLLLIRKAVGGRWYSVANSFNHSKLKNRITMMLCEKSSRWAGAKALLLLPLTAVALGAFAETAYVFPEDKVKKENTIIRIQGTKSTKDLMEKALILVDGKEVKSMDSLDVGRIESIMVLKDSSAQATYGDRAKDGAILVTMRKAGAAIPKKSDSSETISNATVVDLNGIEGLNGTAVSVTSGPESQSEVQVIGYGTMPKLNADSSRKFMTIRSLPGKASGKGNPAILVDGVQFFSGLDAIDSKQIQSITVLKDSTTPEAFKAQGFDGLIVITTKRAAAAQQAANKASQDALKAGAAGIEVAREGLEQSRQYMDSEAWEKAQNALTQAQMQLESKGLQGKMATVTYVTPVAGEGDVKESDEDLRLSTHDKHSVWREENSVTRVKGRVTVTGMDQVPDDCLILINGKRATKADVLNLGQHKIRRMMIYKGDEAIEKYGEEASKGAIDIRTRK